MTVVYLALLVLSWVILLYLEWVHEKERKDLYNRLMARDFDHYVMRTDEKKMPAKPNFIKSAIEKYHERQHGE